MKKTNQEKRMKIMLLNMLIVFILASLAAFIVDGWLLHPIPSQGYGNSFSLSKTDTPYANAEILHASHTDSAVNDVFMVQLDGKIHMLYFARHRMTDRHALKDDVIVEPGFTGGVTVGTNLNRVTMHLENGRVVNRSGVSYGSGAGGFYLTVGMIATALESLLLWLFLKKKYPNE